MSCYPKAFNKAAERQLIASPYLELSLQSSRTRERLFTHFFDQRQWPNEGWDEQTIEMLISELSSMDSNNYPRKAGVGEREGRIFSPMVARRHFRMSHGIGRSGDLVEAQPKAAGSSLLSTLANCLVFDLMKTFVCRRLVDAFVLPMATGMSLALVMQTMHQSKPDAKYVIWSRIDQKSCFKSIITANLIPIIIEPVLSGDELVTDDAEIKNAIKSYGAENVVCVLCTTSCFAPRAADNITAVSKICKDTDVYHLVNNAYGIQSRICMNIIDNASRTGRVDAIVQSTDKNLMVPVGGAIVSGFNKVLLNDIKKNYPGRASFSPTLDVFITMLAMGREGYRKLLKTQVENYKYMRSELLKLATDFGQYVLCNNRNDISIGLALKMHNNTSVATEVGSKLFRRNVNGARVVEPNVTQIISGYTFEGWGSHCTKYPVAYLTCAATIGMEQQDVDMFIEKLKGSLKTINSGNERHDDATSIEGNDSRLVGVVLPSLRALEVEDTLAQENDYDLPPDPDYPDYVPRFPGRYVLPQLDPADPVGDLRRLRVREIESEDRTTYLRS